MTTIFDDDSWLASYNVELPYTLPPTRCSCTPGETCEADREYIKMRISHSMRVPDPALDAPKPPEIPSGNIKTIAQRQAETLEGLRRWIKHFRRIPKASCIARHRCPGAMFSVQMIYAAFGDFAAFWDAAVAAGVIRAEDRFRLRLKKKPPTKEAIQQTTRSLVVERYAGGYHYKCCAKTYTNQEQAIVHLMNAHGMRRFEARDALSAASRHRNASPRQES